VSVEYGLNAHSWYSIGNSGVERKPQHPFFVFEAEFGVREEASTPILGF
jgi:hypothetical protein